MPSPDLPPCVDLSGVTVTRGSTPVLRNITLRLNERRVGVIGRNGSGKSTLMRLISGLIAPTNGTVRIEGMDPTKNRKAMLRLVGVLFQNPDHQIIFPTVGEEIEFGLKQMGDPATRATREILERFDRPHWYDVPVQHLSQGQRHMLCLIAVLVMQPRLILLDEPFAGLDLPTILHLRRHLDAAEPALIHVTHTPEDIGTYDRLLWLERGEIVMDGAPEPVLAAYTSRMHEIGAGDDFTDLAS